MCKELSTGSSASLPQFLLPYLTPSPLAWLLVGCAWPRAWSSDALGASLGKRMLPSLWRYLCARCFWDKEEAYGRAGGVGVGVSVHIFTPGTGP